MLLTAVVSPALGWVAGQVMRRLPAEVRARQLGNTAETIVDLAEDVDPELDHIRGNAGAPVTLLEYGDFECPYCCAAAPTIAKLLEHLPDELRYVWRHLPLTDVHPSAQLAAEVSEAAGDRASSGRCTTGCWPSRRCRAAEFYRYASELGLDLDRFSEDLRRRRFAGRVARDVQSADASGVSGTPTFFINGRRHQGVYDIDTLTQAVKRAVQ